MRLVFCSDLHGNLDLYRAAGDAALRSNADAVVFGGDLCPATPPFERLPRTQPRFLLEEVAPLIEESKRARPNLRCFAIPGNDDFQTILPALEALAERCLLVNLHRKSVTLGGYTLLGLGFVPPTPFSVKDFERRDGDADEQRSQGRYPVVSGPSGVERLPDFRAYLTAHPTIAEELDRLDASAQAEPRRLIAVLHCPPWGTRCDVLASGQHIGSRAIRAWIERRQPLLTLHGHIHESADMTSAFADRIGATWVVNPGADERRPHVVLIDLENLGHMEHSVYGRIRSADGSR